MSKEIKFRAWSKQVKKMMYFGGGVILTESKFANEEKWGMFFPLDENQHVYVGGYEVMQYTGLKDKNGKEIYEGDILVCLHDKEVVRFGSHSIDRDGSGDQYGCSHEVYGWYSEGRCDTSDGATFEIMEIIGNIYENPELLK